MTKEDTKELWKLCFDDTEEFVDLYFDRKYKDEINMTVYDDARLISALQMIPYPMTYCDRVISTSYISGACTHPDFRSKGTMKQLLFETFEKMYESKVLLSTLIPAEEWLFGYYEKSGYSPAFDYAMEEIDADTLVISPDYKIEEYTPYQLDVHSYLNRKMMERPCCIQHPMDDFKVILADLKLSNGKLFVARLNAELVGLVMCVPYETTLYIKELFSENEAIKESLLKTAAQQTGTLKIERILPPNGDKKDKKLGMARIINAQKMLELYAAKYKGLDFSIGLTDKLIATNNGYYLLQNGKCEKVGSPNAKDHIDLDIQQLTQALLGYRLELLPDYFGCFADQSPYMSLMLD